MSAVAEEQTLKLHTACDGVVWYGDGAQAPRSSNLTVGSFLDDGRLDRHRVVRVLGCRENVPLLNRLYEGAGTLLARLEVASPLLCENRAERNDPEITIFRMRQCLLSPALGGWHVFTPRDYVSYAIAERMSDQPAWPDPLVQQQLRRHPAWDDLRFVRGLDEQALAYLIGLMRDPRWYVEPTRPDRSAKLYKYLGLEPHVQMPLTANTVTTDVQRRCFLVQSVWNTQEPPGDAELQIPGNFLWRTRAKYGGWKGDLRASQLFVSFLRHVWLQGLTDRYDLFDPERMFHTEDERAAYREHRRQVRRADAP